MPTQEVAVGADRSLDPRQVERDRIWKGKPSLRSLYNDYHKRLIAACPSGPLLDIGGGTAHVKDVRPGIISVDILPYPGIDAVCDAHRLPFPDGQFAGIVMIDLLHHLERPIPFLNEACRVLRSGGVLAMIEPGMSTIAYPFYRYLHQEPADMKVDPFATAPARLSRDPYDANQAIPTLLYSETNCSRLNQLVAELKVRRIEWLSLFAYPLSGGLKRWCLCPSRMTEALVRFEDRLPHSVRAFFGFRLFVAMQKSG
jgi:SAM-dependent methyltransferase